VLSRVKGAGDVKSSVTIAAGSEVTYAYDTVLPK
jgi:hypothetical protein